MYELTDKEHDAVLQLNDEYREAHFKQKVQRQQGLYILLGEEGPLKKMKIRKKAPFYRSGATKNMLKIMLP